MLRLACLKSFHYAASMRTIAMHVTKGGGMYTTVSMKNAARTLANGKTDVVKEQEAMAPPRKHRNTPQHIYLKLNNRSMGVTFDVNDLSQLVKSWGRSDNSDANQKKHLNELETMLFPRVKELKAHEATSLLYTYALVGRKFPSVVNALNDIMSENLGSLSQKTLLKVLWCCAKLNDQSAMLAGGAAEKNHISLRNRPEIR